MHHGHGLLLALLIAQYGVLAPAVGLESFFFVLDSFFRICSNVLVILVRGIDDGWCDDWRH